MRTLWILSCSYNIAKLGIVMNIIIRIGISVHIKSITPFHTRLLHSWLYGWIVRIISKNQK
jgi:hypothetical protein